MRCAIDFDESKPLMEQEVKAWGELQSLEEEPGYKESDIKEEGDKKFFLGYKCAMDDVCTILENLVTDGDLKKKKSEMIQMFMSGELCMNLFNILDDQWCEEDGDEE